MAFIDYRCQKRVELIDLYLYISACFSRHRRCLRTDVKKNIWHEKAIISGCSTENHDWNISLKSVETSDFTYHLCEIYVLFNFI